MATAGPRKAVENQISDPYPPPRFDFCFPGSTDEMTKLSATYSETSAAPAGCLSASGVGCWCHAGIIELNARR